MKFKRAISPVVATALLLVVAVTTVIGFQNWFGTYSSDIFVKTEKQSQSSNEISIETLVDNQLYVKGEKNTSILSIKVDGKNCNIDINITGIENITLPDSCIENLTTNTPEIVIQTSSKILSKKIYLKNINIVDTISNSLILNSLNCSKLNGGEWIKIPGNTLYGTSDFCVMKYEAKWNGSGTINDSANGFCGNNNYYNISTGCPIDGSIGIVSQASSKPLTQINQFAAIELCKTLGHKYHLITNNEWMTIARDAEIQDSNWDSGTKYSSSMMRGHSDNEPATSLSVSDANNPYDQTGQSSPSIERRTLNISNGEVIWDIGGNVREWTSDIIDCSEGYSCINMPYDSSPDSELIELTAITSFGSLSENLLKPFNTTLTASSGIGKLYTDNDLSYPNDATWNTIHAFLRGGYWGADTDAGAFALYLNSGPSGSGSGLGFRCTYTP